MSCCISDHVRLGKVESLKLTDSSPPKKGPPLRVDLAKGFIAPKEKTPFITFVLGGPGSGKGTRCIKIVETFGFTHLSAGDLLRREIASNSTYGAMILNTIKEGKIVPSQLTVKLIQKEMESSE